MISIISLLLAVTLWESGDIGPTVELEQVTGSVLNEPSPPVGSIAPAPGGGVMLLTWGSGEPFRLKDPESGEAVSMDGIAPPVVYFGGGDRFAIMVNPESGSVILNDDGKVRHRFSLRALNPIGGAIIAGDRLFVLGLAQSGDLRTGAGERLGKCLLVSVPLLDNDPRAEESVCGDVPVEVAAWSIYAGGHLRRDPRGVYAVWDGSPELYVLDNGGRLVRKIRIAEGSDIPPAVTMADRARVLREQGGYFIHRSRYRWAQGTLAVPGGGFAVLFREPASRDNAFTMDIYSEAGDRLVRSLPMDLGLQSAGTFARPVTLSDGRQYILVVQTDETYRSVKAQRFHRVRFAQPSAKK